MTTATGQSATFRAGLVGMRSGRTPAANIDTAVKLIGEAKAGGADYVQTPEMTNLCVRSRDELLQVIAEEDQDKGLAAFRDTARRHGIWLHIGSLAIRVSKEHAANRAFVINPQGDITARYDKIHMFDVDLANGEQYRESRSFAPGDRAVVSDTPFGRLGHSICYDLRFPHLYRALAHAGAEFISVPAAFTRTTGMAHWHVLLRARAIETGAYVFAPAQCGTHPGDRLTYGHALIVAPWGEILADAGEAPGFVAATLDLAEVARVRASVPAWRADAAFTPPAMAARAAE